jgi:hypothetical protein
MVTPEGVLSAALIAGGHAPHIHEVFCHPYTAGELVAQGRLGALIVNGQPAHATVVDRLGNGDYLVRIQVGLDPVTVETLERHLEMVA